MLIQRIFAFVSAVGLLVYAAVDEKSKTSALPVGALNDADKQHFFHVFDGFQKSSLKDIHYATLGNSAFGRATDIPCSVLSTHFDSEDFETRYYVLSAAQHVKGCAPKVSRPTALTEALNRPSVTLDQVYYLVASARAANVAVDSAKVIKLLDGFVSKENSPSGLSTILATAAMLKGVSAANLTQFVPLVKNIISQADEVDGKALYFERGAYTTAFAIESIFKFGAVVRKAPEITEQQVIKLTNSLYGRRGANQIRTAARIASALNVLATNTFMIPVVVYGAEPTQRAGSSGGILVPESRILKLRLVDVLGRLLEKISLDSEALFKLPESTTVKLDKLGQAKRETDFFVVNLEGISHGNYALSIKAKPTQPKAGLVYAGVSGDKIPLRVVSSVKIDKVQFKYSDTISSPVDIAISYPSKMTIPAKHTDAASTEVAFVVQPHSRIRVLFSLTDSVMQDFPLAPHQVFMQLTHKTTHQAITYLCQKSTTSEDVYSFTLNTETAAAEFDHVSGVYKMELIIGDFLLSKPVSWHLTDVQFRFPVNQDVAEEGQHNEDVAQLSVNTVAGRKRSAGHPLIGDGPKSAKPELFHTFRTPEPRPSDLLAYTFTALCFAPFLVVLLAWLIMGANLRNFPCSLSAPLFHLGLGSIFALYLYYWFALNMFTTLRYLIFLGVFTFFFGNRLLRHLVSERRKAEGDRN